MGNTGSGQKKNYNKECINPDGNKINENQACSYFNDAKAIPKRRGFTGGKCTMGIACCELLDKQREHGTITYTGNRTDKTNECGYSTS